MIAYRVDLTKPLKLAHIKLLDKVCSILAEQGETILVNTESLETVLDVLYTIGNNPVRIGVWK